MRATTVAVAFSLPMIVILWKECGLTQTEIHLLQTLFSAVLIILEVPSGYLADVFGNRHVLLYGTVLSCLGALCLATANNLPGFLVSEMFLAAGFALASGADEALLYQSLAARRQAEKFPALLGKFFFISSITAAIFSLLGGWLASFSLRLPLVFVVGTLFLQSLLVIGLKNVEVVHSTHGRWRKVLRDLWSSCRHYAVYRLLFLSAFFTAGAQLVLWLYQPLMLDWGIPFVWYGVVFAGMNFICGLSSSLAPRLEKKLSSRFLLFSGIGLLVIGYQLLSIVSSAWGVLFFSFQQIVRGASQVLLAGALNKHVEPSARASLASVRSMFGRAAYAVFLIPLGQIVDSAGIASGLSYLGWGVLLAFCFGYSLYRFITLKFDMKNVE
jgi:hypothetical protein